MSICISIEFDRVFKNSFDCSSKLITKMVGSEVGGWNPFLASLITLSEELEALGIVYHLGTASYIEPEEVSHV